MDGGNLSRWWQQIKLSKDVHVLVDGEVTRSRLCFSHHVKMVTLKHTYKYTQAVEIRLNRFLTLAHQSESSPISGLPANKRGLSPISYFILSNRSPTNDPCSMLLPDVEVCIMIKRVS